jgi:hypothetical protein
MAELPDQGDDSAEPRKNAPSASPTGDAQGGLLELYKLAVEMADRVSARRALANTFFLTLNSALLAVIGLVPPAGSTRAPAAGSGDRFGLVLLAVAGLLLSLTWWTLLRSYRQLNEAKFTVINAMEERLPATLFSDEWRFLQAQRSSRRWHRYVELGQAERVVPLIYAAIYVAAGIRTLAS